MVSGVFENKGLVILQIVNFTRGFLYKWLPKICINMGVGLYFEKILYKTAIKDEPKIFKTIDRI